MSDIGGIHHVTAICGDPQENLDFYAGLLGMRLVKKSVNQDDPGTYHLFYADGTGQPGSDLTFFPWPRLRPGRQGPGLATEVSLAVPNGSLDFWSDRLRLHGHEPGPVEERFGERALPLLDPHGLPLTLVEVSDDRDFTPWSGSPIDERWQIRRIHSVRIEVDDAQPSVRFLVDAFGLSDLGTELGWIRIGEPNAEGGVDRSGRSGRIVDVRTSVNAPRGLQGRGTVHHVAWRVADDAGQNRVRQRVSESGRSPTQVIDRFWFKSVYFQEPGRVLFEIATDGPGFTVDEDPETLGEKLILPPWLEIHRSEIEEALPALAAPAQVVAPS